MKKMSILGIVLVTAICAIAAAKSGTKRYVEMHSLSSSYVAVVAEGDFEPRSTGSYSVRIYGVHDPKFPADDYICGTIQPRDGSIEDVLLRDVSGDGKEEIIVKVRNAGSGSYLSADAFQYEGRKIHLLASVADLAKDADIVSELKNKFNALEWEKWAKSIDNLHLISNQDGHGPDVGSEEWSHALDRQLGIARQNDKKLEIGSEEWRKAVEKKLAK